MNQRVRFEQTDITEDVIRSRRQKAVLRKIRNSDLRKATFLAIFLVLLFQFVFGVTLEYGTDMEPRIGDRDLLIYYRLERTYAGGDVVVYEKQGVMRVGRIVAIPGETIEITKDGQLVINGYIQAEMKDEGVYNPGNESGTGMVKLKDQEYYILNDVHDAVTDSRTFGSIKEKEMKGLVITVIRRRNI